MRTAARTYLFVPGNRHERFAKALAGGADAIVLDLEDAVAPADKAVARATSRPILIARYGPPMPSWTGRAV